MPLTRRQLLGAAAAFATTIPAMHAESDIVLQIPATAPGAHMPNDFIGLSYEIQQLTDPSFFYPAHTGLIEQIK
jgi:hypothetical protein